MRVFLALIPFFVLFIMVNTVISHVQSKQANNQQQTVECHCKEYSDD